MNSRQITLNTLKTNASFLLTLCIAIAATPAQATVAQAPLLLGGGNVPGNLALVPSVEFPTVISVANISNTYSHSATYTGYFDSEKCYEYNRQQITHVFFGTISGNDGGGYFTPTRWSRTCNGAKEWSGNYLNWATTQTIDPFRMALTGGYRVVDTTSQTILEKATRAGRTNYFPDRQVTGDATITNISPYTSGTLASSVTSANSNASSAIQNYQKNKTLRITNHNNTAYFSVRVEVCKNEALLEANCVRYGNIWKPEGLIQRYANDIRYSAFSYLNIDGNTRNGGVLRAQQKYVGQNMRVPGASGVSTNPDAEWSPTTGIIYANPHNDATGNSGVINYINKFGELTNVHKSNDPASELYYTALRYFKNQGNIAAYSNTTDEAQKDKFPVITDWSDPIQYACQKNVILGIGDVNTHEDRDLPHSDDALNVNAYTQKVFDLEGVNKTANSVFTGRGNSAYIAGLAYYANTTDIRSNIAGKQTVSTYWVDVREDRILEGKANNQYWLAAKYGGFKVPTDFGAALSRTSALDQAWWYTTSDMLALGLDGNGGTERRPDNFFVASDATNMVEGLRKAFAQISNEVQSTTASLATNSTRLETDTAVFQSRLDSRFWSGDLLARRVGSNGVVESNAAWSAAQKLDSLSSVDSRKIFTSTPATTAGASNELITSTGVNFTWNSLSNAQRALLQRTGESTTTIAENRLAYLRGDRTNEITAEDRTKPFRQRGSRLGDIVNSDPQFIHNQDFGYSRLSWSNGAVGTAYTAFRATDAYKTRPPMVLVGANDGMLHGFDARVGTTDATNGGNELFAYVPNSVFGNLINLTDPAYSHRYYVDGTPRASDVYINGGWKTMVVGTTGAGGKSVFALDITNPGNMGSNSVMWEFSHPDMGYTMGQPALVALPNQKFGVIVSSGYHDSAPANGKVWILDAANGSIIRQFELATTGNLGSPLASDTNYDQVADRIYIGDTLGNVWRIDLDGSTPSAWGIPSTLGSSPLFIAKDGSGNRQAITAPLSSAFNDKNEHMVLFGTGSFYRNGDNEIPTNPRVESFYGVIDRGTAIDGRSTLLKQAVLKEDTVNGKRVRAITNNALTTQNGWYIDLGWLEGTGATGAKGERVISKATLRTDRVIFTTMTPSADPCAAGGTSFIMAMNLSSGSRLNYVYFDSSGDGKLDAGDTTTIGNDQNIPWSGISDTGDGVVKGVTPLYKWLCFAGSSGATPQCIPVAGSQRFGRHSWREVRND
ncbi:PilC/PilY family type IV pilus protein [Pseudomonas sp. GD03721]|nr:MULTISPECIES: PilC/PilY family type IV pilus protein [unclassified Pseudomonas]MDH1443702.1 PilC/PilY family type IV pilus protein [Pseudomonas sp. GD03722]WGG02613.1 PilC/PilY family type IV pilus protein [Pseudomonas sp. GD03721]WGG06782.1 PilC/PilY family type IV pilus protein [Pseudomonas sp. GD03919]